MNDRELLELAAKAAGYTVRYVSDGKGGGSFYMEPSQLWWNPLDDDGDALRLAVRRRLSVRTSDIRSSVIAQAEHGTGFHTCTEPHSGDPCAATRRAIVRAAAAIGKEPT